MKFLWVAVAAAVFACPAVAGAQQTPAPSPAPQRTPMVLEKFAAVDLGVGAVSNELANAASSGRYGFRGAMETPFLGHPFVLSLDYGSWQYRHPAANLQPAGLSTTCTAGDAGCVTPVGFKAYLTVNSGVNIYTPAFNATDSLTQVFVGSKISKDTRLYIEGGYAFRSFNYASAPSQSGFGIGLEKLPDFNRQLSFYGSFRAFADSNGRWTGPVDARLGALSGRTFSVDYRMFTWRTGLAYTFPDSPYFADLSLIGDRLDIRDNAASNAVHGAVSVAVGAHF